MKPLLIGSLSLCLLQDAVGAACLAAQPPDALLRAFEIQNTACRGGHGGDPETAKACDARDGVFEHLRQMGWCYGRPGETQAEKHWEQCAGTVQPPKQPVSDAIDPDGKLAPSHYFEKAAQTWSAGAREEAVFWLYVAQLRWRARLSAHPDLDPSGEPALFASLMETVGRPINEYAFGDIARATAIIDRALDWDAANPDRTISEDIRASTRAGLMSLRDEMRQNSETVRRERTRNGLENRDRGGVR